MQIVQISTEQFKYLLNAVCDMDYTGGEQVQICADLCEYLHGKCANSVHKYRGLCSGHAVSAVLALAGVGCTWVRGWRRANTPHSCSEDRSCHLHQGYTGISRQELGEGFHEIIRI